MEKERILIATDSQTLRTVLSEVFNLKSEVNILPDFENDKISKTQAAKLAGITIPTLSKLIKKGQFKEYSLGRRKYFLRSEIVASLRKQSI